VPRIFLSAQSGEGLSALRELLVQRVAQAAAAPLPGTPDPRSRPVDDDDDELGTIGL
jgi:hypothetical protein